MKWQYLAVRLLQLFTITVFFFSLSSHSKENDPVAIEFVAVGQSVLRILEKGSSSDFQEINRSALKQVLGPETEVHSVERVYLTDAHQVFFQDADQNAFTLNETGEITALSTGIPSDAMEKDAVNLGPVPCVTAPGVAPRICSKIFPGRARWREKKGHFEDQAAIALHEYAGILGLELDRYDILSTHFRETLGAQRLESEQFKSDFKSFLIESSSELKPSNIDWVSMLGMYSKLEGSPEFKKCADRGQMYYDMGEKYKDRFKEDPVLGFTYAMASILGTEKGCEGFYGIVLEVPHHTAEGFYQEQLKKMNDRKRELFVERHGVLVARKDFLVQVLNRHNEFIGTFIQEFNDGLNEVVAKVGKKSCAKEYEGNYRKILSCTIRRVVETIQSTDFPEYVSKMSLVVDAHLEKSLSELNRYEE